MEKDADSVSRLRRCGVIFVGKANMHELGMGTTGNNPNYGYVSLITNLTTLIVTAQAHRCRYCPFWAFPFGLPLKILKCVC